jgi:hypothetical protein
MNSDITITIKPHVDTSLAANQLEAIAKVYQDAADELREEA